MDIYFNGEEMQIKKIDNSCLIQGDCIEAMQMLIEQGVKVDAVITDPPYGTSACQWDSVIPLDKMWECLNGLNKRQTPIVLFSNQPFTSFLICSNINMYKYSLYWVKDNATNFLNKKYQPGKIVEDINVFGLGATSFSKTGINLTYNPQMEDGKPYKITSNSANRKNAVIRSNIQNVVTDNSGNRLPNNVIRFNRDKNKVHPTQKPVALMEYLVKTYTNEGDLVLDFTMGSGTTGVACRNLDRKFIGIELDKGYFDIACKRIEEG